MRLIVDTNRIVAALITDSVSRRIFTSGKCELLSVKLAKAEIEKHKKEILNKTNLTEEEFEALKSKLFKRIYFAADSIIDFKIQEASEIMKGIDIEDSPFLSLALAVSNDGIWSDDNHFKMQKKVRTLTTRELAKALGL